MISIDHYFGKYGKTHPDVTPARYANAQRLLKAVNQLMMVGIQEGVIFPTNKATGSQVAGEENGGFRPQDCPIGAPSSAHKEGLAIDLYDPLGAIDSWLLSSDGAKKCYTDLGIYFEAFTDTPGWTHWTLRKPLSGQRFFKP